MTGGGSINLPRQAIDLRLSPRATTTIDGVDGRTITIPLRVGGSFSQPTIGIDAEAFFRSGAEQQLRGLFEGLGAKNNNNTSGGAANDNTAPAKKKPLLKKRRRKRLSARLKACSDCLPMTMKQRTISQAVRAAAAPLLKKPSPHKRSMHCLACPPHRKMMRRLRTRCV